MMGSQVGVRGKTRIKFLVTPVMTVAPQNKGTCRQGVAGFARLAPVKVSCSLPLAFAGPTDCLLPGLSARMLFCTTGPVCASEIRIAIEKGFQHERHEIGHLLPGAVVLLIK